MRFTAQFIGGPEFRVRTTDFRNVVPIEPKEFWVRDASGRLTRFRAGGPSDLTSELEMLWSLGLAPFGPEAPASVVHDNCYRGTLEQWDGSAWVKANLGKDDSDDIYDALMFSLGVDDARRMTIYQGVHLFGWKAFREDRKGTPC